MVRAATDHLPCDDAVPYLDFVHPGSAGRREMEDHSPFLSGEPLVGVVGQMDRSVVEDHMDLCLRVVGGDNPLHEAEKVGRGMCLRQRGGDLSGADVDGG